MILNPVLALRIFYVTFVLIRAINTCNVPTVYSVFDKETIYEFVLISLVYRAFV